jgi:pyruvate formate lyase activating enzyme
MGVFKWKELGWDYELEGVPSPTTEEVDLAYRIIEEGRKHGALIKQ